jgi:hypothetical protein
MEQKRKIARFFKEIEKTKKEFKEILEQKKFQKEKIYKISLAVSK